MRYVGTAVTDPSPVSLDLYLPAEARSVLAERFRRPAYEEKELAVLLARIGGG